jgi:drug/metabolite transporter (DMT)-like permease
MRRFDKYFLTLVYAPVLPILFFLAFWWGSLQIVSQNKIPLLALCGVATGIIADFFVLKRLIKNGYKQPAALLAAIYLFYSVGFFGFFYGRACV